MGRLRVAVASLSLAGMIALWGCDRGDASAPARDHSASAARSSSYGGEARPHAPTPLLDGKPIWADNRNHSAQENVDYQFDRWGAALGARDSKDYARKARAFIEHPPKAVEKVGRPNGDTLLYDKASNIFAIVRRDGAPRLFRKPPGGAADWERAKSEAPYSSRSRSRSSDSGSENRRDGD